jgi:predicted phosphodiesterase
MTAMALIPGEGPSVARFAVTSDIHYTIDIDDQFPGRSRFQRELREVDNAGAHVLLLLGDLGNRGNPTGVIQVGEDAASNFSGQIIAISGNHDAPEAMKLLPTMGIEVLEKQTKILDINGIRIGVYGQNGSLDYKQRESLQASGLSWEEQIPAYHEYTRREYHTHAVREINALVAEGIDVLLVLSHVPLFAEQTTELENPLLKEMTPETGEFIDELIVPLRIVGGGHTHSYFNRNIGRDNPFAITKKGTVIANVATQNARRSNRPDITSFEIQRLSDGSLTVVYPIIPDCVISQVS